MDSEGLSQQEALDRAASIYKKRLDDMIAYKAAMRSFGSAVDKMVHAYIYGIEQWVCGNNFWNRRTKRYFSEEAREELERTGIVKLEQYGSELRQTPGAM